MKTTSWYCLWGWVEVWRAAWIAVYTADLKGRDRGEEAFLGKIRHNILHASSRRTGEAVKRLSDVRHMPETRSSCPHSSRAGTARQAGPGRNGESSTSGSRGSSPGTWARGGEERGGEERVDGPDGVRMNWVGGRYQIPSLPHDAGEATFLIKEKQPL